MTVSARFSSRRRREVRERWLAYAVLVVVAAAMLLPLYVMVTTSLKSMDEIRGAVLFALPAQPSLDAWVKAWSSACTGLRCEGLSAGFWNSVVITVPSVVLVVALGAVSGYALSFWRLPMANLFFGLLLIGGFFPYQVLVYPLVRITSTVGIFNTLQGIIFVHTAFALPVVTLLFRNAYAAIPIEIFKAARIDGAGFWRIFVQIVLPMSLPIVGVAAILQVTFIWNDYLVGLVFGGVNHAPMTVQLNNIVGSVYGEREYNVEMAATLLTSIVPLTIYLISGKFFVRGLAAGAVKG